MLRVCAEGIITFSLLLTFLLQLSTFVKAVDIYVWDEPACGGIATVCKQTYSGICCGFTGGDFPFPSVSFEDRIACMVMTGYVHGTCTTPMYHGSEPCMDCTKWGGCSGAKYSKQCKTSDGLWSKSGDESSECTTPSGLAYRENGMKGLWRKESSNTTERMELKNLPQEEKVQWLKSHGATYIDSDTGNLT